MELDRGDHVVALQCWLPPVGFQCRSKVIRGTFVINLSPLPSAVAMPAWSLVIKLVPGEGRVRIRKGGIVVNTVAGRLVDGRG